MRSIKKGAASQSVYFEFLDSTSTTGGRKTGLAYNTSSLTAYYVRNQGSAVAITLATLAAANSAFSSGGFKEVDSTNMPGVYRLDVPDAAFAAGAESVVITMRGATGMAQASLEIALVDNTAADIIANTNDIQTRLPAALVSGRMDASVGAYQTGLTPLQPTVAGRTLDVTAGGEAGLDWANIGSPTTSVALSGTTVGLTSGTIQSIWDALTSALNTAGSIGALLVTNINATVSSRLASASYTAPLDAAGTRSAVGLASANLDTQLDALPTANENADALLDRTAGVETSYTPRQTLRLLLSSLVGRLSGAGTGTEVVKDINNTKTRITYTTDSNGNRTNVSVDVT